MKPGQTQTLKISEKISSGFILKDEEGDKAFSRKFHHRFDRHRPDRRAHWQQITVAEFFRVGIGYEIIAERETTQFA